MKPIILIVIDSLSWRPLKVHLDKLPAFKYLLTNYDTGWMVNDLKPPKGWDDPVVLTSFCSATSLWTGKTPKEHKMLTSAWYKCVCPNQNLEHEKPDFKREDIKAKFLWELIPNSVALHTLLFPMINWNCKLEGPVWDMENKIKFPYEGKARFSFPAKITMLLTKESVKLLTEKKPDFFTCGLYGLDTPSHYNWVAPKFEELYQCYKVLDDYLMAIMPFLKKSWFMITTQHGMDDWYIVTKRKGGRPMGHEGIHGDHDEICPFFTNMDKPKSILDVFPIIVKYAKKEGMING